MQNQPGAIRRQMALVIEPALDEKQDEKEKTMNTQLKPVSIIRAIEQGTSKRFAQYTLIGATLAVLLVATIAMSQTFTHRSPAAINHSGATTQQRRFLEANTTSLPASVQAVVPVAVSSERMKFLEANTVLGTVAETPSVVQSASARRFIEVNTNLGMVADTTAPAVVTSATRRFIEVNTNLGMVASPAVPAYPYGETVTPLRGPR